jgi:protein associated with RNAse G/E
MVRVIYTKYDGALHWNYICQHLGEDEHGIWVGAPTGTPVRRGELATGPVEAPHVLLFPRDGWWTGCFNAVPHRTEIYCDVTTVPQWHGTDEVMMVDLDLDVRRRRTGAVELLDEDEFVEHGLRYGYPAEIVSAARTAASWLFDAVTRRAEPFGDAYHPWLARVT